LRGGDPVVARTAGEVVFVSLVQATLEHEVGAFFTRYVIGVGTAVDEVVAWTTQDAVGAAPPKTTSLPEPPARFLSPTPVERLVPPHKTSLPVPPARLSVPSRLERLSLPPLPKRSFVVAVGPPKGVRAVGADLAERQSHPAGQH
jgi:hypothetical protein